MKRWDHFLQEIKVSLVVFFLLLTAVGADFLMMQRMLLQNVYALGTSMADSYGLEAEKNLTIYETLVDLGAESAGSRIQGKNPVQQITAWTDRYAQRLDNILGQGVARVYTAWNGKVINETGVMETADYDYTTRSWYQVAMYSRDRVIMTDAYNDAYSGGSVITLAKKCDNSDAVFAMDIYLDKVNFELGDLQENDDMAFFLCDRNGVLINYLIPGEKTHSALQGYVDHLQTQINLGAFSDYDSSVINMDGEERGVYYSRLGNGWMSIVTIPREQSLRELKGLALGFGLVAILLGVLFVVFARRNWKDQQIMARVDETNQVLGDFYYAIYRVDLSKETYEAIKSVGFLGRNLPVAGPYRELMESILSVLEEDARADFRKSFSTDNVKNLINHHILEYGGDFRRRFSDGYRWVNVRVLYDEKVSDREVVLCFREVDQEKEAELQERKLLEASLQSARKSEKSKQAFFSSMSHDMRTPLNAIIGLTDLASKHVNDPERVADYLEKITVSSHQLLTLINDILEMSRLEQGKVELDNQQMDLRQCLGNCLAPFRAIAEREEKIYRVHVDLEDPLVLGDPMRISQIMNNLLSNAFKFTPKGGTISVTVTQVDHKDTSSFKFIVSDSGSGMSPEFLPRLFEPYTRETRFGAKRVMGTGLGMSIVKSLVTQMSGNIYVASELNKGTTFTIILPFDVVKTDAPIPEEPMETAPADQAENWHILLAEDNPINMEITTEVLSTLGMTVTQAWNGREALETFQSAPPFTFDAILMDMQMPEMDGCEAARHIRALVRPDAAMVPIIAVTANAFSEDIAATTEAGMNAHISKPIDFKVLHATLTELLRKRT